MSVLNPVIDHLDPQAKLIYLATDVRSYHPIDDIYKEVRNLRATTESLQQYFNPVSGGGAVPKGGGKFTPRYAVFNNGWRIVPEDVSHTLNVTGEQLTAEGGSGPECFDFTVLSVGTSVIINYEPSASEIIQLTDADILYIRNELDLVRKIMQNRTHTDPNTGKMVVYDDNDSSILVQADLYEDTDGTTPYSDTSTRIDRRNRLA